MSKVPRNAWKPGALWRSVNERGTLEAIIMGKSTGDGNRRTNYKQVHMVYVDGPTNRIPIQQSYSHAHMLRHFTFTGEFRQIPEIIDYSDIKF
jgi:hypothetical protein